MANPEHVGVLGQGVEAWNAWRLANINVRPNLARTDLSNRDLGTAKLFETDLSNANLAGTNLSDASLFKSDLSEANLTGAKLAKVEMFDADLFKANLSFADLSDANVSFSKLILADLTSAVLRNVNLLAANLQTATLVDANLIGADLFGTNLSHADLSGTEVTKARLNNTIFGGCDLSAARGLAECVHEGPSTIDFETLSRSRNLPRVFLRGCGLPDRLITYLDSLRADPIRYYSCFISHSTKDESFVRRLYTDLQGSDVRCWYAPEDLKIGDRFVDVIDRAIRLHDRLLLVLSKNAIGSEWVRSEVDAAKAREREPGVGTVLFPVMIDGAVLETDEPWARWLKDDRHIGDFRNWKNRDAYRAAFERLLRDLKGEEPEAASA